MYDTQSIFWTGCGKSLSMITSGIIFWKYCLKQLPYMSILVSCLEFGHDEKQMINLNKSMNDRPTTI